MEKVEGQIPPDNPPYHTEGWLKEAPRGRAGEGVVELSGHHGGHPQARLGSPGNGIPGVQLARRDPPHEAAQLARRATTSWAARGIWPIPRSSPPCAGSWRTSQKNPRTPSILWGDSRIGNMIFREGECVAVLDWEMAGLGDPEQDLAWWLFLDRHHSEGVDTPRIPGLPSHEETVARYEEKMGRSAKNLDYYEIFAATHFSTMMMRIAQQLVHFGFMPEENGLAFERNNIVTRLLAKLMGLPDPRIGSTESACGRPIRLDEDDVMEDGPDPKKRSCRRPPVPWRCRFSTSPPADQRIAPMGCRRGIDSHPGQLRRASMTSTRRSGPGIAWSRGLTSPTAAINAAHGTSTSRMASSGARSRSRLRADQPRRARLQSLAVARRGAAIATGCTTNRASPRR